MIWSILVAVGFTVAVPVVFLVFEWLTTFIWPPSEHDWMI